MVGPLERVAKHDWDHSEALDLTDEGLMADLEKRGKESNAADLVLDAAPAKRRRPTRSTGIPDARLRRATMAAKPTPFSLRVGDDVLADLKTRLTRVRWPDEVPDNHWQVRHRPALSEIAGGILA